MRIGQPSVMRHERRLIPIARRWRRMIQRTGDLGRHLGVGALPGRRPGSARTAGCQRHRWIDDGRGPVVVMHALGRACSLPGAPLADALIAAAARSNDALPLYSFDADMARHGVPVTQP